MNMTRIPQNNNLNPFYSERLSSVFVFCFWMIIAGMFSVIFGQDNNWDLRNYHIYNAYAFYFDRSQLDILPAQLQSFFNPLADIWLLFLIGSFKPIVVGFILGAIHGINYFLIFIISLQTLINVPHHKITYRHYALTITPFRIALLLSLAAFIAPDSINLLGTSYHDNLISIPILLSIWLILLALQNSQNSTLQWIFLGGAAAGLSFGLKMTSGIYILASGAALSIVIPRVTGKIKVLAIYAGGFIGGAILTGGFWYLKLYQEFGNPIFPWFNNIFKSPELLDQAFRDIRFLPSSLWDGLSYPLQFMYASDYTYTGGGFRDARFAILFICLIILAYQIVRRRRDGSKAIGFSKAAIFILSFSFISYSIWIVQFSIYRYLFIVEALAFVCIATIIYQLSASNKKATLILVCITLICLVYGSYPRNDRIRWQDHYINAYIPNLEGLDSSMVFLGGNRPTAFLIPGFPETTRFVRLNSNLHGMLSPNSNFHIQTTEAVMSHKNNFYMISWDKFFSVEKEVLSRFDLEIDTTISWQIPNPHEPQLIFWRVNRK